MSELDTSMHEQEAPVNPVFIGFSPPADPLRENAADSGLEQEVEEEKEELLQDVDVDQEYEVEAIISHESRHRQGNRITPHKFLIKWKGFDESHNSWEPEENLICDSILNSYLKKNGLRRQPSRNATKSPAVQHRKQSGKKATPSSTQPRSARTPRGRKSKKKVAARTPKGRKNKEEETLYQASSGSTSGNLTDELSDAMVLREFLQPTVNDQTDSGCGSSYGQSSEVEVGPETAEEDAVGTGQAQNNGFDGIAGILETAYDGRFNVFFDTAQPDSLTVVPFEVPIPWKGSLLGAEILQYEMGN